MKIFEKLLKPFDKLEDYVRMHLSRTPIVYATISGVGIVLFFRGVWNIADKTPYLRVGDLYGEWITLIISLILLLITGTYVSHNLHDEVILSGIKQEKKAIDKTAEELKVDDAKVEEISRAIARIEKRLSELEK